MDFILICSTLLADGWVNNHNHYNDSVEGIEKEKGGLKSKIWLFLFESYELNCMELDGIGWMDFVFFFF